MAELLVGVLIIGILVRIAMPGYQQLTMKARAAAALADIQAIRVAAYEYNAATNRWPPDVNRGIVPPELQPYLGAGFTFTRDRYLLDWDNWSTPDGTPTRPGSGVVVGVSMTTTEEAFGEALIALVGDGMAKYSISEHYTFIIEGV